jgi:Asp-tRNA(Asn)/Glu-tRNA(Gln) amidotransferase B subunit
MAVALAIPTSAGAAGGAPQRVCPGPANPGTARCHSVVRPDASTSPTGLSPATIKSAYGFSTSSTAGAGKTIAIVDAYDDPTAASDLAVFSSQYGLPAYDAQLITSSRRLADWYEEAVAAYPDGKAVANWVMGDLLRLLNAEGLGVKEVKMKPEQLASMLKLMDKGTISGKIAKTVFEEMFQTGKDPETIVKEKGLVQISDEGELVQIVEAVIAANPASVADYKAGKDKAIGFLVGQIMKETKGRANPALVNDLLRRKLSE